MKDLIFLGLECNECDDCPDDCPRRHSGQRGAFDFFRTEAEVVSELESGRYVGGDVNDEYVRWEMRSGQLVAVGEDTGQEIDCGGKTVRAYRIQPRFCP
jgi:hypothetical protein